jgi:hypothetical protein
MQREEKVTEYLKYTFTDEELLALSKTMAKKNQDLGEVEDDKKRITADFSAKIQSFESEISALARKVYSGYEHRNVECKVLFHTPDIGMKTVVRTDSGEVVREEAMSTSERQEILPFVNGEDIRTEARA